MMYCMVVQRTNYYAELRGCVPIKLQRFKFHDGQYPPVCAMPPDVLADVHLDQADPADGAGFTEMRRKAPAFRHGDISRARRICVSN